MQLKKVPKLLLAALIMLTSCVSKDIKTNASSESIPNSHLMSTQEFIDNCNTAIAFADKNDFHQYYRTECVAFTMGLSTGKAIADTRHNPLEERKAKCFHQENDKLIGYSIIKSIIPFLENEIRKDPGLRKMPAQYELIFYGAEEICSLNHPQR